MYDKREPFQVAKKALNFNFNPSRFEEWENGKQIRRGELHGRVQCIPSFFSEVISEVKFFDFPEELNIRHTLLFDMTFTSNDRIYLATVPKITNINAYDNFQIFKANVPFGFQIETREKGNFDENEPYVCSIFTTDGKIVKVSFSFGNRPRLIELYDDVENTNSDGSKIGLKMAYKLVEILIKNWNKGNARINEENLLSQLKLEFPEVDADENTVQELITFINSILSEEKIITRFKGGFIFAKKWILMTKSSESNLNLILKKIEEII
jgi:hypothetical protein